MLRSRRLMHIDTNAQRDAAAVRSVALRKVVWSSVLGSTVEWYDFTIYGNPLRDADDEFGARSQFWGRLLKAMNIPDALRDKLKTDLDALNKELLKADPRLAPITDNLKTLTTISSTDSPGDIQLRSLPLQPWDMLSKTEVIYRADNDRPWLPLTNHGQGIQSLAVIFLSMRSSNISWPSSIEI